MALNWITTIAAKSLFQYRGNGSGESAAGYLYKSKQITGCGNTGNWKSISANCVLHNGNSCRASVCLGYLHCVVVGILRPHGVGAGITVW